MQCRGCQHENFVAPTCPRASWLLNHRRRWRWRWNWLAYIPLVPYLVWLIIRHRSPTVFTAANPGIATGGTVGESKAAILRCVERAGGPVAEFSLVAPHSDCGARVQAATRWMNETGVPFPVIVKPDVGEQGWGVALICTRRGLERYFECMQVAIIVQRYLYGIEAGIFYCRRPGAERGRIVSISESIHHRGARGDPCPEGAPSIVFGFTCHDAEYRDALNWKSLQLERAIDEVGRAVPGFFFGRFDVRAGSADALRRGEFTVIELNGVLSESIQIYDPAVNLARACATLVRQWRVAFEIGAENRARGTVPARLREIVKLTAMKIWRQMSARRLRKLARMSLGELPPAWLIPARSLVIGPRAFTIRTSRREGMGTGETICPSESRQSLSRPSASRSRTGSARVVWALRHRARNPDLGTRR